VLAEFPVFPSFEIEVRLTVSRLYALILSQPWHPDLQPTANRVLAILPAIDDPGLKMQCLHGLLGKHFVLGEVRTAGFMLNLFRGLERRPDSPPFFRLTLKVDESLYYLFIAEFQECMKAVEDGLEIAAASGVHVMDVFLLGHAVIAAVNTANMETADLLLAKMPPCLDQNHFWSRQFYHFLIAWKSLIQRNFANALTHSGMALKLGQDAGVPYTMAYGYLVSALTLHELKRYPEAMNHLVESCAIANRAGSAIHEFSCLLAKAKFAFDSGDDSNGFSSLEKALSLGRDKGYVGTLIWMPAMMGELCRRALEAGIEVDYVSHLIRKRNLMPDLPPSQCERWPWALEIYTLGRFGIVRHGEAMQFSGKVQKKPLEMLKALIAKGCREVSEEQIADCLWPDARGDAAHNAFTTTLSRLRRLLGVEEAVRFQEGRLSLDSRCCWVDAQAFESIFAQFEKEISTPEKDRKRALHLFERAVGLYVRHFLPADEGDLWTISYRERLRDRFSRLVNMAGRLLQETGQWEKAAEYYQKGLDIDDLSEDFYRGLMICYRQLGLHSKAIEVYKRCRKLFSKVMGIEPSAMTKAVYDGLKASERGTVV
jgi:DNA-binding SARP family transcriptional activator